MTFPFDALRRRPDVEAPGLVAFDAADRLLLDESAMLRAELGPGELVVIGDSYGALGLAAAFDGATGIRVHQDSLTGERALAANAEELQLADRVQSMPLGAELVQGARVVLLRLPRSLDELRDIAAVLAAYAPDNVVVFAGGRLKHMSLTMNDVLRSFFDTLDVTHARQKSRVLIAQGPRRGPAPEPAAGEVDGLAVRAFGGAFAGTRLDIGTRMLLTHLPDRPAGGTVDDPWIDLACGTGIVAARLAVQHPDASVYATDQSSIAVASARATAAANGVADRIEVVRDDALQQRASASASFIALNPPFHSGGAVTDQVAPRLFADAGRVLRPRGELWAVWNSPLGFRPALERLVGPTRQVARDTKFTVTVSTKR